MLHPQLGIQGLPKAMKGSNILCFWDRMKQDVCTFVVECDFCQRNKGETIKSPNTLQPLPIPPSIWRDICYSKFFHTLCIMLRWPSLSLCKLNFPILLNPKSKIQFFVHIRELRLYNLCIHRLLHYIPHTLGFVLKIKKHFEFSMQVT
jgi:hypothetical protein